LSSRLAVLAGATGVTAHAGIATSMPGSQPSEDRRPVRGDRRAVKRPGVVGQSLSLAVALPQLLFGDPGGPLQRLERGPDVVRDDDLDRPQQIRRHVVRDLSLQHRVPIRGFGQPCGDGLEPILDSEEFARHHPESGLRLLHRHGVSPRPESRLPNWLTSTLRYWIASARWAARIGPPPARSAMVRATRRRVFRSRTESPSFSKAASRRAVPAGSSLQWRSKSAGFIAAFRPGGRAPRRRSAWISRAWATRCATVAVISALHPRSSLRLGGGASTQISKRSSSVLWSGCQWRFSSPAVQVHDCDHAPRFPHGQERSVAIS